MKSKIILLGTLGSIVMLSGCQDTTNINDDIQSEIEKGKQAQEEVVQSQDLSSISGDAKNISEKISDNKKTEGNSGQETNLTNNKNNMEKTTRPSMNKEDIDMELAKTCKSVVLETNLGDVEIEFFGDKAPMTVANFCTLVKKDFYNGLIFHRIIKDFMIQGGDPTGTGMGDAGYKFKDEIYAGNSNDEYTIAMANAGPNTNGSQFFINTKANNFLDTKHTVFGKVIKGQEIVDKMESVETGMADRPVTDVTIVKAIIVE
jgi:peptidylprolyl isomerase